MEKVQETGIMKKLMMLALAVVLAMPAFMAPSASAVGSLGDEWQDGRENNNDYTDGNDDSEDYGAIPGLAGGFDYDVFGSSDPLDSLYGSDFGDYTPDFVYEQDAGVSNPNGFSDAQVASYLRELNSLQTRLESLNNQYALLSVDWVNCLGDVREGVFAVERDKCNKMKAYMDSIRAEIVRIENRINELKQLLNLSN